MELKDVILSTLAEMEDNETTKNVLNSSIEVKKVQSNDVAKKHILSSIKEEKEIQEVSQETEEVDDDFASMESEESFLNSLKERMLVLFEGFQAPNNTGIDAKVDMTLNFLEYVLANIDLRTQEIKKGRQK